MTTVTVDCKTRDLLVDTLRSYETGQLEGFHEDLRLGSREEVTTALAYVAWIMGFLDQTGWDEEGDRDSYELTLDDSLVEWIVKARGESQESLEYEVMCLERTLAGVDGYEQPIDAFERYVAQKRRDVELFDSLVERLPTEAVA
jgi:hypothetical protein